MLLAPQQQQCQQNDENQARENTKDHQQQKQHAEFPENSCEK
jgi:hypothetical protein